MSKLHVTNDIDAFDLTSNILYSHVDDFLFDQVTNIFDNKTYQFQIVTQKSLSWTLHHGCYIHVCCIMDNIKYKKLGNNIILNCKSLVLIFNENGGLRIRNNAEEFITGINNNYCTKILTVNNMLKCKFFHLLK